MLHSLYNTIKEHPNLSIQKDDPLPGILQLVPQFGLLVLQVDLGCGGRGEKDRAELKHVEKEVLDGGQGDRGRHRTVAQRLAVSQVQTLCHKRRGHDNKNDNVACQSKHCLKREICRTW